MGSLFTNNTQLTVYGNSEISTPATITRRVRNVGYRLLEVLYVVNYE